MLRVDLRRFAALIVSTSLLGGSMSSADSSDAGPGREAAPQQASRAASEAYQLDGREVTAAEFEAFRATLHGSRDSSCKKTTFGGITSYSAQDASGRWHRVQQVAGGGRARPSSITLI